jgi:hypothetical protein
MSLQYAEAGLGRWFYSWGTTNGPDANLGPADDRTCFLSGVAGNLNAGDNSYGPGWPSKAQVSIYNGGWWLRASGGGNWAGNPIGNPVLAHAVCINTVAGRTPNVKWQSDWGPTLVAPVTPKRRCFLTGVWGVGASWMDGDDYVRVTNDGTNWWIDGAVNTSQLGSSHGYASAMCVDMPTGTSVSSWTWYTNDPGSWTPNVGYDSTGMACALTGVQGHFTANDWTDGALINWPSSFPGYWKVALKNGKKAWVTCMQ